MGAYTMVVKNFGGSRAAIPRLADYDDRFIRKTFKQRLFGPEECVIVNALSPGDMEVIERMSITHVKYGDGV